jgi:hypothetical protein
VAVNIVGVSGKNYSSLGKIVVCPEGGGGVAEKNLAKKWPKRAPEAQRSLTQARARMMLRAIMGLPRNRGLFFRKNTMRTCVIFVYFVDRGSFKYCIFILSL